MLLSTAAARPVADLRGWGLLTGCIIKNEDFARNRSISAFF